MEQWADGNEIAFLKSQGYYNIQKKDGEWCAMLKYAYSVAIIAGLNEYGFENRWCYHDPEVALEQFIKWDGTSEPDYWHRHVPSMRRRNPENEDIGVW